MRTFVKEFAAYLVAHRKLWLMPIFVVLLLIGGLLVLVQGSALAPFIYTVF